MVAAPPPLVAASSESLEPVINALNGGAQQQIAVELAKALPANGLSLPKQRDRPNAIDLSHHINMLSRSRHPSPLKDIVKYMALPGMISLGGGLPHPSLFPFASTSADAYPYDHVIDATEPNRLPDHPVKLHVEKYQRPGDSCNLEVALQYGYATGMPFLRNWVLEFTKRVSRPAYADYEILLTGGNTEAWAKVVSILCDYGDHIIVEEHTFPSAQALWIPMNCKGVPIKMDAEGMLASDLDTVLTNWNTTHPGVKRPHVIYTVPIGQNPTGVTTSAGRKQQIYSLCVKHDLILVEDDPYSFLQFAPFKLGGTHQESHASNQNVTEWLASLSPSYLRYDDQGRVIRLETFSKTIAPGNRLGWVVANPIFAERLLRVTEVTTQSPSGWTMAIISDLLAKWGVDGYLEWMSKLQEQYRIRRDWMLHAFATTFDLIAAQSSGLKSAEGLVVCLRDTRPRLPIFSFIPPRSGMFIFCKFHLEGNATFEAFRSDAACEDPEEAFMHQMWLALADAGVLVTPGNYYIPYQGTECRTTKQRGAEPAVGHYRMTYAMTTKEDMREAIVRMERVLRMLWDHV